MEKTKTDTEIPNSKDTLIDRSDTSYTTLDLGVWRVLLATKDPDSSIFLGFKSSWNTVAAALPLILRFLGEIYHLRPDLVLLFFLLKLWSGAESVLMLYVSSRLLRIIEVGLAEGRPDVNAICQAIMARLLCVTFTATTTWARGYISPILESCVRLHFQEHLLRAELRMDMPTSSDNNSKSQASAAEAWRSFESLCEAGQGVFELASQLLFISQQKSGGPLFTLLATVKPLLTLKLVRTLWMKPSVQYSENVAYLRLRALKSMSQRQFRGDVIAGNIADWITAEYHKARMALGLVTDAHAFTVYATRQTPFPKIATELCGDLPTLYWAVSAMLRPGKFSMASIAILQQYSSTLNYTLQSLFWDFSRLASCVSQIKLLYEAAEIENKILDGDVAYPRPGADATQGMDIELQNVSFAYPGDKSKDAALRDVSLRIPAGSLAVIVGANGGGKSTIIKLLTRMYDTDAGTVLVDGLPIARYRLAALRQAQATLTQHHSLYPLTLAENIGLGYPERVHDLDMVLQAAADGGAAELLDKFKDGAQTNLDPVSTAYGYELDDEKHKALKALLGKLEKTAEVSGGEKQRLVASRTFMRFRTGKTKLLCVDEPSSALDPKGEHALFERLRETGTGRTMIFVTHRFGHLTKYADIIICMKEGKVAESGTHNELMALNGEYASLYNVQAQAFSEDVASEEDDGKAP